MEVPHSASYISSNESWGYSGYWSHSSADGYGCIFAPIELPQGAIVSSLTIVYATTTLDPVVVEGSLLGLTNTVTNRVATEYGRRYLHNSNVALSGTGPDIIGSDEIFDNPGDTTPYGDVAFVEGDDFDTVLQMCSSDEFTVLSLRVNYE